MSFRRNSTTAQEWNKWLLANRDKLFACGIPEEVLESKKNWFYFLGHGYFTRLGSAEPSINLETMDRSNAECGKPMESMGRNFKAPRQANEREWKKVEILIQNGFRFFSSGYNGRGTYPKTMGELDEFLRKRKTRKTKP